MIKLVYCIQRRNEIPATEFYRYWLKDHGPLVARVAKAIRAVKYVQSHTVEPELNAMLQQSRGLVAERAPAFRVLRREAAHVLDIGAGDERLLPRARQHDRAHALVGRDLAQAVA